jgi:3-deoxy-D-manno-octulosonic acid (KDO) 8-phosphate synthase
MEIHDDVDNARSDAATQWPLRRAEKLLRELREIRKVILKGSLA